MEADRIRKAQTREIMPPQRPNLILPTHIPHIKLDILIRHRLNIKPHRRDRSHVLVELELVQNRCHNRSNQPVPKASPKVTYSSSQLRLTPASTAASLSIRRSCPSSSISVRPFWRWRGQEERARWWVRVGCREDGLCVAGRVERCAGVAMVALTAGMVLWVEHDSPCVRLVSCWQQECGCRR